MNPMNEASSRGDRRGAFSLIELLMGMAVLSVLMLALASTLVFASKALPDENRETDTLLRSAQTVNEMTDEMRTALYFSERTATAATFVIPDRTGDGLPDRVRYVWSGTAGDPLTRAFNGGTAVNVIDSVQSLAMTYQTTSSAVTYPGVPYESAEQVLFYYDNTSDAADEDIKADKWWAQYFKPNFIASVMSWKVTRVYIPLKEHDAGNDTLNVELRMPASDNRPSSTILQSVPVAEGATLTSAYQWIQVNYTTVSGLDPTKGLCLALTSSGEPAYMTFRNANVTQANSGFISGNGSSWNALETNKSMRYYVYGTGVLPGPTRALTRERITAVRIAMQASDVGQPAVDTSIAMLNRPEVLSARWETTFDLNPAQVDYNGDGAADWSVVNGGTFNTAQVANSVFSPTTQAIWTEPLNNLTEPTTVDVRFCDTVNDGNPARVMIIADRDGTAFAAIYLDLNLVAGSTQTFTLQNETSSTTVVAAKTVTGLATGYHDVRLIIDPATDTMALFIDNVHKATMNYPRYSGSTNGRVRLIGVGSGAQFDEARIRVGGTIANAP